MVFAAAQAVFLFTFPRLLRCTTNLIEFYGIKPTQCSSGISTSRHAPGVQAFDAFKLRSLRSNSLERDHRPVQWLTPESICIRQIWSCQSQRYRFIKESYLYAAFLYLPGVPALTRFVRAPRFLFKEKSPVRRRCFWRSQRQIDFRNPSRVREKGLGEHNCRRHHGDHSAKQPCY